MNIITKRAFILGVLLLSACSQIEHQSDMPEKIKLSKMPSQTLLAKKLWSTNKVSYSKNKEFSNGISFANKGILLAGHDGKIAFISPNEAKVLWELKTKHIFTGTPVFANGTIFVTTSDAKLLAISYKSKKIIWEKELNAANVSKPLLVRDNIVIHTVDGCISSFATIDGKMLWSMPLMGENLSFNQTTDMYHYDDKIYGGSNGGQVFSISNSTGQPLWSTKISEPKGRNELQKVSDVAKKIYVDDKQVIAVNYNGNLVSLDKWNGQINWHYKLSSMTGATVSGNTVLVSSYEGEVVAININNGKVIWKNAETIGRKMSLPVIYKNKAWVLDKEFIHCISLKDGKTLARYDFGYEVADMVLVKNKLFILSRSGKLSSIEFIC